MFVYYSAARDNRIARLKLGQPPEPIVTGIPVTGGDNEPRFHQGGRLAFGPDGMLYASVGETYYDSEIAQNRGSLGGKILRMTLDGQPAPGIAIWTPTSSASPSGIAVLGDHIYVACLRGQALYRLDLDGRNPRKLLEGYGRLRTVAVAPDGSLWVTTSNRDQVGREDQLPQTPEGDRILRITPP